MVSDERLALGTLTGRLVHPTAPVLLTKSGPLGTRIQRSFVCGPTRGRAGPLHGSNRASRASYPFKV